MSEWVLAGLLLAVAPWALTTAHETSHLVMAVVLGLRPASVSIGRGRQVFGFRLGRRRLPVQVRRNPWFGQVVCLPQPSPLIRLRLALFFSTGIVVNILLGLGCLVVAFGPWSLDAPSRVTLAMIGFYSVAMGATNAMPLTERSTGSPLDGLQLLRLLLHRMSIERDITHRPVQGSVELNHPAAEVWAVLEAPDNAPWLTPGVMSAYRAPGSRRGLGERQVFVREDGSSSVIEVVEYVPGRRAVARRVSPKLLFPVRDVYEVEPRGTGCVLTYATEYDAPREITLPAEEQESWRRANDHFLHAVAAVLESRDRRSPGDDQRDVRTPGS